MSHYRTMLSPLHNSNTQAELCTNCHSSPKRWSKTKNSFQPYCSKTCATQARNKTNINIDKQAPGDCDYCHSYPKRWDDNRNTFHPYCSKTCANDALGRTKNNVGPGNCDHCHSYPKRWDANSNTFHPYCSKTCANEALGRSNGNTTNINSSAPTLGTNCDHCNLYPKRWDVMDRKLHPYCSRTCANQALGRGGVGKIQTPTVSNDCIHCGIRPKHGSHPYCGRTCAQAAKSSTLQPIRPSNLQSPNTAVAPARWSIIGAGSAVSSVVGTLLWGRVNMAPNAQARGRILFYHRTDPYYGFTNFSPHPVTFDGKEYPTSEHLFQAFKFMDKRPDISEKIRTVSSSPRDAFTQARVHKADQHPDWLKMNIEKMDVVVWHKFTQHEDLKQELLGTGDAELVEDSAEDAFWGIGKNQQGRNELGKALERLRSKLRGT